MKKFTKFALGCTVTCVVAGLGLLAAGLAMGAGTAGKEVLAKAFDETINSENIRWSVTRISKEEDWEDMEEDWSDNVIPDERYGINTYEFDEHKNLDIELSSDELYFRNYSGSGIRIETEADEDKVRIKKDGDTLEIKSLSKLSGTQIIVYYPENLTFQEVDIEVDAGMIYLEDNLIADDLEIQVGAGEMDVCLLYTSPSPRD